MSDTAKKTRVWQVAVNAPLNQSLSYLDPIEGDASWVHRGVSVFVPLGKRQVEGVVLGESLDAEAHAPEGYELKSILSENLERPRLDSSLLHWIEWLAQYYVFPIGLVSEMVFPSLKKGGRATRKKPLFEGITRTEAPVLTEEQSQTVRDVLSHNGFRAHLIFGVTGSGKTEIYLKILDEVLKTGKAGLVIVPEISLTPQLIQRFAGRFGDQIAVLHSHLTDRERTNQWWSVVDGSKRIVIGARSALFCPIPNLGLIVVDEEHEPSFKQDEKLKYNGRDAAIVRAKQLDIPVLLGSATPSLESWRNAQSNKYTLHTLTGRATRVELPNISVVDMKAEEKDALRPFWLSRLLHEKLGACLDRGEQAVLFLNRRGAANMVVCRSCGQSMKCPNCSVTLTLHGHIHLVCHYCDYHESLSDICSICGVGEVKPLGVGTELLERDISKLFPQARVLRADRDEIQSRDDLENMIQKIESGESNILIGTQMIAKGLDFENLNLVGVVLADIGFNIPDFRATERSFQLLTQVAGRAGRRVKQGEVVIQAFNPSHISILCAQKNDFLSFAEGELAAREELFYPPFSTMACVRLQGIDLQKVKSVAETLLFRAQRLAPKLIENQSLRILGPVEAPISKLRGNHRYQVILKCDRQVNISQFCRQVVGDGAWIVRGVKLQVDIDPINMM